MKVSLKRGLALVVLSAAVGGLLAGCGDLRQQALEVQTRLDGVMQRAEIAEAAAVRNASLLVELEHRIEALETALAEQQKTQLGD